MVDLSVIQAGTRAYLGADARQLSVALLLPCLLTGGTEVATFETAMAFKALGYQVDVVVYFDEVDLTMLNTFEQSGLTVLPLGVTRDAGLKSHATLAIRLLKAMASQKHQVIWLQYMTPTLLPLALVRLFTSNLIAAVHVVSSHYSPRGLNRMGWLARHWCARFVCVSHTVADGIFGGPESDLRETNRVAVIPNSLDMASMQAAAPLDWRLQTGWPLNTTVIGFAGRLAHNKGADVLLRAVALLQQAGVKVRLVLVGDGAEQVHLVALAQQLGISAITFFAGRAARNAIYSAIKGFDIAAVPSREEGFGLSALEAMAAGVPVVASRVDALQEVVQDGVTGLLCQVDDPQSLADALARLVADLPLRQRMGAASIAHATLHYDTQAYRAHLSNLLVGMGLPVREAA